MMDLSSVVVCALLDFESCSEGETRLAALVLTSNDFWNSKMASLHDWLLLLELELYTSFLVLLKLVCFLSRSCACLFVMACLNALINI